MLILKTINSDNNWKVNTDGDFKRISTIMDGKEVYFALPINIDNEFKPEENKGVLSFKNLFLDLNDKGALIFRNKKVKLFDDTSILIRYKAPEGKKINSIGIFNRSTSVRYAKLSKDKTEIIVLLSYRFKCRTMKSTVKPLKAGQGYVSFDMQSVKVCSSSTGACQVCFDDNTKETIAPMPGMKFPETYKSFQSKIIHTHSTNIIVDTNTSSMKELMQNFNLEGSKYAIVDSTKALQKALHKKLNEVYVIRPSKEQKNEILKTLRSSKMPFRLTSIENDKVVILGENR